VALVFLVGLAIADLVFLAGLASRECQDFLEDLVSLVDLASPGILVFLVFQAGRAFLANQDIADQEHLVSLDTLALAYQVGLDLLVLLVFLVGQVSLVCLVLV
jgi:hypothetical protein